MPDIKKILSIPGIYRLFVFLLGGDGLERYAKEYIRPKPKDKILDIGCGPADILNYLPEADYLGFDISPEYIAAAKKRFGSRGSFICRKITKDAIVNPGAFDLVLAIGVLHHLTDDEAVELFELSWSALKPGGRLVTLDGCYTPYLPKVARFLMSRDRGKYIRTEEAYRCLAERVFLNIETTIITDLNRLPFTHINMECVR